MVLHTPLHSSFDCLMCPFQVLRPTIFQIAQRARTAFAAAHRSAIKELTDIDTRVFDRALRKTDDPDHIRTERFVATLGAVHPGVFFKHHGGDAAIRPCCEECECTILHIIYSCKHPDLLITSRYSRRLFYMGYRKASLPHSTSLGGTRHLALTTFSHGYRNLTKLKWDAERHT